MTLGTLDVHLEPVPGETMPRIVLLLAVDGFEDAFRVHLSPAEAERLARTLAELVARQARVGKAGEN